MNQILLFLESTMDETSFQGLADQTLQHIAESLENADSNGEIEIDFLQGILHIELPAGEQYIINKHSPTRQIWLSSPVSGAHHFSWDDASQSWISSGKAQLHVVLQEELAGKLSIPIQLA